ncbi:DUF305 domain-containing protein [Meiothermus sp.]|jgi:uncharacterized protein (DUF305 family)|uniref:DUF305 domain-containing protein n=1 Tax=Meiothermus sp. TaxID=1955249 RepID=UPI0021DEBCFE|nr:DUF305 domain-containing protein [Meiothermus sp.]GIW26243.1 MAG: hypothetical protein KatS3mg069_2510 [Meiothermus sp.]
MHAKIFGFVAALLLGWGLAQTDHSAHGSMAMQSMAELGRLSGKEFDIAYMSMMIEHHKGAVEMAGAILKVSKDARIRKAAQEIVAVQNKEIAQLTAWLKAWYGAAPSQRYMQMMRDDMKPMMEASMMGMQAMPGHQMPVDRAFLEGMIPHHQDAVNMSQICLQKAARAELKRFCQGVIAVQSREIEQYQQWLKSLP